MPVMIGIPVKNDLESLKAMIHSLFESTNYYSLIYIVESSSSDKADEFCDYLASHFPKVEVIHANTPTPLQAYNMLFQEALIRKMDLLLTQTDVIFPKLYKRDWLERMHSIANVDQTIGAITSLNGGGTSGPDYIDGFKWLGGWCSYYPLRTIEKIGGYDTNFPNGFGVDIDHSYRIYLSGLKSIEVNYWVDHHMSNERQHDRNPNTERMKKESSKYFKKKWKIK